MSNEKKYTQEEIKAIVEEELRKANLAMGTELNMDEMETVAGGNGYTGHDAPGGNSYVVPKTHEEIDAKWDIIDYTLKNYGPDAAYIMTQKLQVLAGGESLLIEYSTNIFRKRMHDDLDGKISGWDNYSAH